MRILVPLLFFFLAGGAAKGTDFIRTNCDTTLYPDLCYHSLAAYSSTVQQNPARLARVAVGVSLSRAKHTALYVANFSRRADYSADPRAASALHDCLSVLGDAVDLIRASLNKMRRLTGTYYNKEVSGEELRFQLSDVQTWMSAALTNEDTCTDGFEDVADGEVKTEVRDRTLKAKEVTSNALALVNMFVSKVMVFVP